MADPIDVTLMDEIHTIEYSLILIFKMNYDYNSSKILEGQDHNNQSMNSQQVENQVRFL